MQVVIATASVIFVFHCYQIPLVYVQYVTDSKRPVDSISYAPIKREALGNSIVKRVLL